jgi:hypothetical protein
MRNDQGLIRARLTAFVAELSLNNSQQKREHGHTSSVLMRYKVTNMIKW